MYCTSTFILCMYNIYIYTVYIYKCYPPTKTYLLGSRYVLDISFLTAYIVTCCSTQPENAFSNGNALRKSTHTHTRTHTHRYTCIYIYIYTVHAFGYCIVTLAGHWSSNIYNMGTALWSNPRFEHGFHVFYFWLMQHFTTETDICLFVLLSRCFWKNSCQEVIEVKTQVVPFLFQRWHPFLEQWAIVNILKVSLKSIDHSFSATPCYTLLKEHDSHDTALLDK